MIELIKVKDYKELSNVAGKIMLDLVKEKEDSFTSHADENEGSDIY